jgi:hypothetical protein
MRKLQILFCSEAAAMIKYKKRLAECIAQNGEKRKGIQL